MRKKRDRETKRTDKEKGKKNIKKQKDREKQKEGVIFFLMCTYSNSHKTCVCLEGSKLLENFPQATKENLFRV